ncbi:MAG: hypothetical protein D6679_03280 [Candidatus Hydrogenedentota bacterium]|nr:MAG: hypothetical protein D6679_03280 [Candidatus Hydrogenedentota bacterium]
MFETLFSIAGKTVRIASDRKDSPYLQFIEELGAHRNLDREGSTPDAEILLHPRDYSERSPLRLPKDARLIRKGNRRVYQRGKEFFIDFHQNAFFRLKDFHAEGVCYFDETLDPVFWSEICINHVLFLLLRRLNRFPLHAGGVQPAGGPAVFFVGKNGAGKTTATVYLANQGCSYFGDDIVLFDSQGYIYPYLKRPALTEWTLDVLHLRERVVARRRTGKFLLPPFPAALPTKNFRIFLLFERGHDAAGERPGCSIGSSAPLEPAVIEDMIRSQTEACHTDNLLGAPCPPLDFLVDRARPLPEFRLEDFSKILDQFLPAAVQ